LPPSRSFRNPQRLGSFLVGKPGEEPELNELRRTRVLLGQFRERLVHFQEGLVICGYGNLESFQIHPFGPRAALQ